MAKWGGTYTVGTSKASDFPMAIFAKTGGTVNVVFDLTAAQAGAALTLRVGTTLSFKGGRPQPRIGAWSGATPKVPKDLNSRGITRGGYRGFGEVYDFPIPAGTLKAGRNTLSLGVAGSGDAEYLSANYIVDAVELMEGKVAAHQPR
jgi:rhamnogalacturonan endolyase